MSRRLNHKTSRMQSEAVLAGRIFDDRCNRMSPTHARKGGVKYRYYISSALLQGTAERAPSFAVSTAFEPSLCTRLAPAANPLPQSAFSL